MTRVAVWYEDQLTPRSEPRDFGPHNLLLSCLVDDRLGSEGGSEFWSKRRELEQRAYPFCLKGNGNLRDRCGDPSKHLHGFKSAVALFDFDKVVDLFPLADRAQVRGLGRFDLRARLGESRDPQRRACGPLFVRFLDDNVETLLRACGGSWRKKPTPDERDIILLPFWRDADRAGRDQVRGKVCSFNRLVLRVGELLQAL